MSSNLTLGVLGFDSSMDGSSSTIANRFVGAGREIVLDPAEQPTEADVGDFIAVLVDQLADPAFESGF